MTPDSAGEARHPRGDVLASLTQLGELRLRIESRRDDPQRELMRHRQRSRVCATRTIAETFLTFRVE